MNIDRPTISSRAAQVCSVMIFLLPALALTTHVSVGLIEAALLLSAIGYAWPLWQQRHQQAALFATSRFVTLAFAFNLLLATVSVMSTRFDGRFLENPSKILLAAVAVGLILLLRPAPRYFWFGIFAGTITSALFAAYQRFVLMMPRAEGFSMPITFGDIAMSMALMSLAAIQQFARTRWAALPYVAFVAGVIASVLSGSRGGWLALVLSFVPLYSYGRHAISRRSAIIIGASIALLAAACALPQSGVPARLTDVTKEITLYRNGNPETSVGTRLENWKAAWTLFIEHPVTGVGRANYNLGLRELIKRGETNPIMLEFYHAHNEMLNAMATQGLLGVFALIALYAAPLLFFTRQLRTPGQHRQYALAGVLLVLSYIDFGLTQVMFAHHVASAFYAVTVCALIGLCLQEQRIAAGTDAHMSGALGPSSAPSTSPVQSPVDSQRS